MAAVYWIHLEEHSDLFSEGYIGFTSKPVKKRISEHFAGAKSEKVRCPHLEKAIRKYGTDRLIVKTVCIGTSDYCLELENRLRPRPLIGWNVGIGGEKPAIGRIVGEETRKKLSIASSRQVMSDETKAKLIAINKGNKYNVGKTLSEERKAKIAASLTGKKASPETRLKHSLARKGKPMPEGFGIGRIHSIETKQKMANAAKQRWQKIGESDELRKKIALNLKSNLSVVACPHCGTSGKAGGMRRWHFNFCKQAPIIES